MELRRDERRQTGRRRLRELAAIATALLVVPFAAVLGLRLPLDASGVLAPIFDLPRTAFGHVRSSDDGAVQLSGSESDDVTVAMGGEGAFMPPTLRRHRPHHVVSPAPRLVVQTLTPGTDAANAGSPSTTPDAPPTRAVFDDDAGSGMGTSSRHDRPAVAPDDPPRGGPGRADVPEGAGYPTADAPGDSHWTPPPADDGAPQGTTPTGDEPASEPTGSIDEPVGGPTGDTSDEPVSDPAGDADRPDDPPADPGAPGGGQETLSTGGSQEPGAGPGDDGAPSSESTDQPAGDETGQAGDTTATGDAPGTPDDTTEGDGGSTSDDSTPGVDDEPPAGQDAGGDETGGDPGDETGSDTDPGDETGNGTDPGNGDDQGDDDQGNGNGQGNGQGNGNGNQDGCYGSGQGQPNGNGNGPCAGQGVGNGHDPNHHGGADEGAVLATPLLVLALAGCERRVRLRRGRREP